MRSVYIHIPFCKSICSYCDFCKMYYNKELSSIYLSYLEKEIDMYYEGDTVKTIYIGGGTPSSLDTDNLNKLFRIINKFKRSNDIEFTFECNIDDINDELLTILKENNVNRISIGVESFNKDKLKYLNRSHNKKEIFNNISLVKKYGFNNINVDLIYATIKDSSHVLKSDLKNMIKLDVPHISTYSLIIEEHTVLYNNKTEPVNEQIDFNSYKYICKKLKRKGFHHYEVSNFALPGYESKHNLTYWDNEEYYGFGLGAHGYINEMRYENTRNMNKYLKCDYRLNELLVSSIEEMENEIILGLRKLDGISVTHFHDKFKRNIFKVFKFEEVIKKGYVMYKDDMLYIPEDKIYVMNEIINMII